MRETGPLAINEDGSLTQLQIELVESSGPVSPRYQYTIHVRLYVSETAVWLDYNDSRKSGNGKPVRFLREIGIADVKKIVRKLERLDFVKSNTGQDFTRDVRSRVGISFNWLTIRIDPKTDLRIDYLLADFERDDFADYAKAIDIIKNLVKMKPGKRKVL